jgi:hypothetical protein
MLWLLYPQRNTQRYPLGRRVGRLQSRPGRGGKETITAHVGNRIPVIYPVALSLY